ncbi:MAG: hypothetical protein HKO04_04855 [Silicimonas sp.]|nr:hypothetical protein [Silicimonas sp.]
MNGLIPRIRRFHRGEDGVVTVETVLWIPMFFFVFGLVVDVAMLFHGQAKVLMVTQNGNREFSIGNITMAGAETFIETEMAAQSIQVTATTAEIAGLARTVVSIPATELQVLGYFNVFPGLNLTVTAEHTIENWEV